MFAELITLLNLNEFIDCLFYNTTPLPPGAEDLSVTMYLNFWSVEILGEAG